MAADTFVVLPGLGGSAVEFAPAMTLLGGEASAHLPPDRPAVVIGHSLGGVHALRVAEAHPGRVRALVLTGSFYPPARDGSSLAAAITGYGRHRALYVRDVIRRNRAPRPTLAGARDLMGLARLGLRPRAFHELASRVRCPVLAIHGRDDHVVPVAFARAAVRCHPDWTYREVPEGGHLVHRQRPQAWTEILSVWLSQHTV